jgi:exonuclease I
MDISVAMTACMNELRKPSDVDLMYNEMNLHDITTRMRLWRSFDDTSVEWLKCNTCYYPQLV